MCIIVFILKLPITAFPLAQSVSWKDKRRVCVCIGGKKNCMNEECVILSFDRYVLVKGVDGVHV